MTDFKNENSCEEENKTIDTEGETPDQVREKRVKKVKSDLDVLNQKKLSSLGDSQRLLELKEKQAANPWELDEEKHRSELDFFDQGISALQKI